MPQRKNTRTASNAQGIEPGTPAWNEWIEAGIGLDHQEGDLKWEWGDHLLRLLPMEKGKGRGATGDVEGRLARASTELSDGGVEKTPFTLAEYRRTAHAWSHSDRGLCSFWVATRLATQSDHTALVKAHRFTLRGAEEFVGIRARYGKDGVPLPLDEYLAFKEAQKDDPTLTAQQYFAPDAEPEPDTPEPDQPEDDDVPTPDDDADDDDDAPEPEDDSEADAEREARKRKEREERDRKRKEEAEKQREAERTKVGTFSDAMGEWLFRARNCLASAATLAREADADVTGNELVQNEVSEKVQVIKAQADLVFEAMGMSADIDWDAEFDRLTADLAAGDDDE